MRRYFRAALTATVLSATSVLPATSAAATPDPVTLGQAVHTLTVGPATAQRYTCTGPVQFRSVANGRYVSAELGYGGASYAMLRARATAASAWEQYSLCRDTSTNTYSFRSNANGRYVSAELGYGGANYGMLRARATAIGTWERYSLYVHGGYFVIRSAANGRYVSAELGYGSANYGMLRARATAIGTWEQYR